LTGVSRALAGAAVLTVLAAPGAAAADTGSDQLFGLVDAAAQRLQTADPVAASKWLTGGAITDPARVQQVLTNVGQQAESVGVPADYVTTAFTDQINATEAIEYNRFSWWKFDPTAAPSAAPDLATSRAEIDALNQLMVSEMARQWPVLRSPDCPAQLRAAKSEVAAQRQLDPLYRQALDTATRSYCTD
jgi:chorismate mutase